METLQEWKLKPDRKIFAYCLITKHVHLIIAPGTQAERLILLSKRNAERQTYYFNTMVLRDDSGWREEFNRRDNPVDTLLTGTEISSKTFRKK